MRNERWPSLPAPIASASRGRTSTRSPDSIGVRSECVDLVPHDFVRDLIGVKLAYFFTPRIFVQSLTQFNNQTRAFTANVRFAWLRTANTGLFVVLNDGELADSFTSWRRPIARSITVKYSYQLGSGG